MDYGLLLISASILLNLVILKALIEMSQEIRSGLEQLDHKTAEAIASVVEKFGGGGFEPVNPVQAAIANLIQQRIQPGSAGDNPRDLDGKFKVTDVLKP
mgnify:CR=1 FL=1